MARNRFHRLGVALAAGAGTIALASTPTAGLAAALPSFPFGGPPGDPYACLAADVFGCSIVFGGSGIPIPHQDYVDAVNERFIQPLHPGFTPQTLFTPEGLQPFTGVKTLPLDESMAQGLTILQPVVQQQLDAGRDVNVYGYSQSASIDTLLMRQYLALPPEERPDPDQLSFTLLGNPNNPVGGMLQMFNLPQLGGYPTIPSLGVTFDGATPDVPYSTNIYTLEYDGFADFPRYPLNLLADLNAVAGIVYTHDQYPMLPMTPDGQLANAILLPGSVDYLGPLPDGVTASMATNYWMIPTEHLPLLEPLRAIPVLGNPLADLLEPDLRVLVNLGYGQIDHGWDAGPANVPTTLGLFPADVDFADVWTALANGAQQGVQNFIADLGSLSLVGDSGVGAGDVEGVADTLPSFTDLVNAFSGALSAAYSVLLPTADIANALFITLPSYMVQVFVAELSEGDILNAIGLPVAAAMGLGSLALGFELISIQNAISEITADFAAIMP